jgi:hypothetical protein
MNEYTTASPSIRGLTYPLKIKDGNLAVSTDFELKSQQIRSVVETRFYERVMRADYGVGDHTLDIMNPGQINSEMQHAISTYVEGLTSLSVRGNWISEGDDGIYRVFIYYAIDSVPQPPIQFSLAR